MTWAVLVTFAANLAAFIFLYMGVKSLLASLGAGFAAQGDRLKARGHLCLIWAAIMLLSKGLI